MESGFRIGEREEKAMPVAEEKLPDKRVFDVYAMMVLLTCVALGGAIYFLFDELNRNWYGDHEVVNGQYAAHITKMNDDPKNYKGIVNLREVDLDEYKLCRENNDEDPTLPGDEKEWRWPSGYDPLRYALDPLKNNWADAVEKAEKENDSALKEQLERLIKAAKSEAAAGEEGEGSAGGGEGNGTTDAGGDAADAPAEAGAGGGGGGGE